MYSQLLAWRRDQAYHRVVDHTEHPDDTGEIVCEVVDKAAGSDLVVSCWTNGVLGSSAQWKGRITVNGRTATGAVYHVAIYPDGVVVVYAASDVEDARSTDG